MAVFREPTIRRHRRSALSTVIAATSLSAGIISPALAQTTPPESSVSPQAGGLEDIVVTARRTAESLQDTPVSVSAFTADFLEKQNVVEALQIARYTPNLLISRSPGHLSSASVVIRGIGQRTNDALTDPGVGMYLDGVYIARVSGALQDLVDPARIEVLRGPQGTLFGRNTIGGAVQIITRDPTDEMHLEGKTGYGSFGTWYARAVVNTGYIAGSPIKITAAYNHRESDGWVDNALTDDDPYGLNSDSVWVRLDADITEDLKVRYSFDWGERVGQSAYFQITNLRPDVLTYMNRSESLGGDPLILSNRRLRNGLQEGFPDENGNARWHTYSKSQGHNLTLEYSAGEFLNLKSITAYRKFSLDSLSALSGNGNLLGVAFDPTSPTGTSVQRVTFYQSNNVQAQRQISQEFQATGRSGDFSYVAGAYYFHEKARATNTQFITFVLPGASLGLADDFVGLNLFPVLDYAGTAESWALFGQTSWTPAALDGKLEITGGIRKSWDYKTFRKPQTAPTLEGRADFENLSWLASASYKFTDDVMVYGRVSTGYKSGGFNPVASAGVNAFGPEKVLAYEVGVKAEWLDRRLRTNVSLFRNEYTDKQTAQFVAGASGADSVITNAGEARIQGGEIEVVAVPVEGLNLSGSLGYIDASYKEFIFRDPATDLLIDVADEARFEEVPKWTWSAAAEYNVALADFGELLARVAYTYRSKVYFHTLDRITPFNPQIASPGQGTLSARLTLSDIRIADGPVRMEVSLWGDNLADNDKSVFGIDFGSLGFAGTTFAEPRSFGIDLKFNY